jgi:hypothetical protein
MRSLRISLLVLAAGQLSLQPLAAQQLAGGSVNAQRSPSTIEPPPSVEVLFPPTPVGTTATQDCYFNCFFIPGMPVEACGASGTIGLIKPVGPPFAVSNLRKGLAASQSCGGTPVTLPVTLQAGEWLLQDFRFSPTAAGTFQDTLVYDASGATFIWGLVGTGVLQSPRILSFAVAPSSIRAGQSVTLSWITENATSVVIDNGVGSQTPTGTVTRSPAVTTTYRLTAMNSVGLASETVTVTVFTQPSLAVTALPPPIVQLAGGTGGATRYTVTNPGGTATSVTATQSGTFFQQTPNSFTLQPGATQEISVTTGTLQAGSFDGSVTLRGTGVADPVLVPIKALAAAPPSGTVVARPGSNRVDVAGPPGASPTGTVTFNNSGNSALSGILTSDAPWLIPQSGVVTIPPGGSSTFNVTIDRTRRTESDLGSTNGSISLSYLSGGPNASQQGTGTVSTSLVTVVDTVQLTVTGGTPPALQPGEIALFVPGVGHIAGSVGTFISDLAILNPPGNPPVNDIRFFYTAIGGGDQKTTALPPLSGGSLNLADVVKNVFGSDRQVGSLQIRSASASKLSVSTSVFNSTNPAGTYGTALPVFRSDRGIGPGGTLVLAGLRRDATSHTNLFLQEMSGNAVTVQTEFLAANGSTIATRSDEVAPFALSQINNVVPEGGVAAILTATGGNGRFLAYATPVDDASGDNWSVVDWSRQFGYSGNEPVVIPVAGVVAGANNTFFRTDLTITNSGTQAASGTLRYIPRSGDVSDRQITLGGRETTVIGNVIGSLFNAPSGSLGFLLFTPVTGTFVITSRTYTTVSGQAATFGTGVPTLAVKDSLKPGLLQSIASIEDASLATIGAARPATFRTNFALVETSGSAVTVRVSLRFSYPQGNKLQVVGSVSKDYNLAPNQYLQLNRIAAELIGPHRETIGDLRGLEVSFQVVAGIGRVAVFTSSTDNGTGDSILRIE